MIARIRTPLLLGVLGFLGACGGPPPRDASNHDFYQVLQHEAAIDEAGHTALDAQRRCEDRRRALRDARRHASALCAMTRDLAEDADLQSRCEQARTRCEAFASQLGDCTVDSAR